MKQEILSVVETDGLFFLRTDFDEGDAASGVGHVLWFNGSRDQGLVPSPVLATNEPLRHLWASPSGALWVAGASGTVGTTAATQWPACTRGADYATQGAWAKWSATDLPAVKATRLPPNVTALWGVSDSDVYVGTYGGHIYRWNGQNWHQAFEGPGQGRGTIHAFGGASNDVYAVGKEGTVVHFDGSDWRSLTAHSGNGHELLTGVVRLADGQTLISASGDVGRVLRGSATAGFTEVCRSPVHLLGMALLGDRLLFATFDGVAELIEHQVKVIKPGLKATSIRTGKEGRVLLTEADQAQSPRFAEYAPANEATPWWRYTF